MTSRKSHRLLDTGHQQMRHYFLIAGEVMFEEQGHEGRDGQQGSVRLNVVVQNTTHAVPAALLGKAQQMLQARFFQQAGLQPGVGCPIKVVDVFTLSVSHLGRMTEAEFNEAPKASPLTQRPANAPLS